MSIIRKHKIITIIVAIVIIAAIGIIIVRRMSVMDFPSENIIITSSAFEDGGTMPVKYTGKGEDLSPELILSEVSSEALSVAVIMDDLDVPFGIYNHWVIWNLPVQEVIPEAIEHGAVVNSLNGAVQGKGYGRHCYKGPNPPFGTHRYQFHVFVLDCKLELSSYSGKKDLMKSMEGHILQYGSITGKFK
ncbi:MAG TPA: YbhB/YbcL family Raf kinase inhibitor-like protein [Mobilitalea sp.]|nr:YbhB/YbcL family Raf kinase inhibitor-like protein [Mobilitalea sp.]